RASRRRRTFATPSPSFSREASGSPNRPPPSREVLLGGNRASTVRVRYRRMNNRRRVAAAAVLLAAFLSPSLAQTKKTELKTPVGRFPLEVTAEYLGMASERTVVRIRLAAPELSKGLASHGVRFFSGELHGAFLKGEDIAAAFRYPVSGELDVAKPFTYSFLRSVPPGSYKLKLTLTDPNGHDVGQGTVDLSVPELGTQFRPEMAPAEASTLPSAEAI